MASPDDGYDNGDTVRFVAKQLEREVVPTGWTNQRRTIQAGSNGAPSREPGDESEQHADHRSNGQLEKPDRFRWLTAAELAAGDFRQAYLIDGILVEGQPGGIFGSFKTLKTSLALDLGISLASGSDFLGYFRVLKRASFAYMCGESGLRDLQDTARRICHSRGLNLDKIEGFHLTADLPRLENPDDRDEIERFILRNGTKVLAIDPAYLCMDIADRAGNLFAMGVYLRPLADLCRATGCAPLIVHHNKRQSPGEQYEPPELSCIAWSGFAEFSAQWILLGRRSPFDPETGHNELWMNVGGRAGHCGLFGVDIREGRHDEPGGRVWEVSVRQASDTRAAITASAVRKKELAKQERQAAQAKDHRERALAAFAKYPDGETQSVIKAASGLDSKRFPPVLGDLLTAGDVEPCQVKKNGRTLDAYRLTRMQSDGLG